MLLLALAACTDNEPTDGDVLPSYEDTAADTAAVTDTSDPPPEDLGDPYLAMVVAIGEGILLDTCSVRIDVFVDGEAQAGEEIQASGGEWVGFDLDGASQYNASAVYQDCSEYNPSDTVESGTFSGVAGYVFLFWFNGANAGYTTLEQTTDYHGGMAEITLREGADTAGIEAIAADEGVTLVLREGTTWDATFDTAIPVARVLAAFSRDEAFVEGSPSWIDQPDWW